MKKMCIVLVATNYYFPLGLRFINQWHHFYKGKMDVEFHFYSEKDPTDYVPDNCKVIYKKLETKTWSEADVSRMYEIASMKDHNTDYIYIIDADTVIKSYFDDYLFQEGIVAAQHCCDESFETNKNSACFFDVDDSDIYYQTWFLGGNKKEMIDMCAATLPWIEEDFGNGYIPDWAAEKYFNKYLHFNKPNYYIKGNQTIPFFSGDKGDRSDIVSGIYQRPFHNVSNEDYLNILNKIIKNKNIPWDILNNDFAEINISEVKYFEA